MHSAMFMHPEARHWPIFAQSGIPFLCPVAWWFFAPRSAAMSCCCTLQCSSSPFFCMAARQHSVFTPRGIASAHFCTPMHSGILFSCHKAQQWPIFCTVPCGVLPCGVLAQMGYACTHARTGQPDLRPNGQQPTAH